MNENKSPMKAASLTVEKMKTEVSAESLHVGHHFSVVKPPANSAQQRHATTQIVLPAEY